MTARLYFSAIADADFAAIIDFLTVYAGRSTAAKYRDQFRELFQRLSDLPESGPRRRKLGNDIGYLGANAFPRSAKQAQGAVPKFARMLQPAWCAEKSTGTGIKYEGSRLH